jgi:sugar phosphate isomerase/epimerase
LFGEPVPASRLSLQLYTVRGPLGEDLEATLLRVAEIGFRNVEPFGFVGSADRYKGLLDAAGLAAPSGHAGLVGPDRDPQAAIDAAVGLGMTTIVDPSIHIDWASREAVVAAARELSGIARTAAEAGVRVGYHNHWQELEHVIDGVSALEVFADALDDSVVLEVDTYWAEVGGASAVELLGRLGDRVALIHVKDGALSRNDQDQTAVGSGSLDVGAILAAAPQALRVVELDGFNGDIFDAVRDSFVYLTAHGVPA